MSYLAHIERALAYIEENLKSELCLGDLAKATGYSRYHFIHIFKLVTKLTPADYIRKRRLSEIARAIYDGNRCVSEVAFAYGFNSKENFTRAFKAEHNCLPTEYKAAGNSLKLFDRFNVNADPFTVTPRIVDINGFSLTVFPAGGLYPPRFWNEYNCGKLSRRLSGGENVADYGVSDWDAEKKVLHYFIGIRTDRAKGSTKGTVQLEIPAGKYAVFTTPPASPFGFVNTMHRTWQYINEEWMPNSAYERLSRYEFETYTESSRKYSEDIYIPIKQKEENP
jgi:AraC family transcriptional regulator